MSDAPPSLIEAINRAKLKASDGAGGDLFGISVAVDRATAVVGARDDTTPAGNAAGSAYVFVRAGTAWTEQAHLTAPDAHADYRFGVSVAVDGDTVLVGADQADTPAGAGAGSAYVFVRSGTSWIPQAKLIAPDGSVGHLGNSVALNGDTALVGAWDDTPPAGTLAGSAYVFVRTGTTWAPQAKLTASDGAAFDQFGISVALDGATAVVGEIGHDFPGAANAGSAYVFVRSGIVWTEEATLAASGGATNDDLGWSVAVDGDTAVVGADQDDTSAGTNTGSAYVFVRSGTFWTQQTQLTAPDGAAFDFFGYSVAVIGNTAVVGAFEDDTPAGRDAGSAYVVVRSGTTWTPRVHLTPLDADANDLFGVSVALDRDTAVIGADGDDAGGSAYVFWR